MFLYVEVSIHILRFRGNSTEKEICFQQMALGQLVIHVEKKEENIDSLFLTYIKMNSKRITDINVKSKTINLL